MNFNQATRDFAWRWVLLLSSLVFAISRSTVSGESPAVKSTQNPTQVGKIISLLKQARADPIVLHDDDRNQLVVVAPNLVGRVICTGMDGTESQTNAFVNAQQIREGFSTSGYAARTGEGWNNFGGAERIWFAPEGGPHGFFFKPGVEQNWHNYLMSEPLQAISYETTEVGKDGRSVTFEAPVEMTSYAGHEVTLHVKRTISLLEDCPFALGLSGKVDFVGFESRTCAKNLGDRRLDKTSTPVAIWTVGIFNPGPQVIVLLPYKEGSDSELGNPITTEYFRYFLSADRDDAFLARHWSDEAGCVLVKADGKAQLKLEMLKRRSLGRLAAVDLGKNEITIVDFNLYPELDYAASFFLPYDGDPLDGGVMSAFMNVGQPLSAENPALFELETCSPIMELNPNAQFCHASRTYRVRTDRQGLMELCERFFNVDEKRLTSFDSSSR